MRLNHSRQLSELLPVRASGHGLPSGLGLSCWEDRWLSARSTNRRMLLALHYDVQGRAFIFWFWAIHGSSVRVAGSSRFTQLGPGLRCWCKTPLYVSAWERGMLLRAKTVAHAVSKTATARNGLLRRPTASRREGASAVDGLVWLSTSRSLDLICQNLELHIIYPFLCAFVDLPRFWYFQHRFCKIQTTTPGAFFPGSLIDKLNQAEKQKHG